MAKSTAFAGGLLGLALNNAAIASLGANRYLALHTADPGAGGNQSTNEATYPGYARVEQVAGAEWEITDNVASPAANIEFPLGTAGADQTVTHWSIGTAASGGGVIIYSAELVNSAGDPLPKLVTEGDAPVIFSASTITET